jgi:macrodomain Ter protein organizer (MatP/YcbG family)
VSNVSSVIGPSETWEPTNKTISIRKTTWQRLQKYGTYYGSTYDSIIAQILDEKEGKSIPEGEGSFEND